MNSRYRISLISTLCLLVFSSAGLAGVPGPVGGDRDGHGCVASAGYRWCDTVGKCERPWELAKKEGFNPSEADFTKFCTPAKKAAPPRPAPVGGDRDAHGCVGSAGYLWCAHTSQCERPWELAKKEGFTSSEEAFAKFCGK